MNDYAGIIKTYLIMLIGVIAGYYEPVTKFLILTYFLVFADIISGRKAAKVKGEKITSKKLKRKIKDVVWFTMAIILAHHFENVFFGPDSIIHVPLVYPVALYIASIELYSNFENISKITGRNIYAKLAEIFKGLKNPVRDIHRIDDDENKKDVE